jgi:DNA-nicking Smr family endonuclease
MIRDSSEKMRTFPHYSRKDLCVARVWTEIAGIARTPPRGPATEKRRLDAVSRATLERVGPPDEPEDPDRHAFEQAMSGVRMFAQDRLVPEPIWRPIASISERERETLRALDDLISGAAPLPVLHGEELLRGHVPGLDPRVVQQLARGEFTIQAELDLHGVDSTTARAWIERFLIDAHARQLRCVKIVHGKGRRSPNGIPVLKSQLPRWLARGPARHLVLAYTSAPPSDGGSGATYVLLRRQRVRASDPLSK